MKRAWGREERRRAGLAGLGLGREKEPKRRAGRKSVKKPEGEGWRRHVKRSGILVP